MESGYYPPGAEHDPNAPYNQVDPPEREFKVTATFSVDKEVTVRTSDYVAEEDWDDDMGKCESIDTSDTNWIAAYQEQHESIEDLLCEFKTMMEKRIMDIKFNAQRLGNPLTSYEKKEIKHMEYLIEECQGWATHDFEVVE
jgi:hypothetical protein